MLQNIIALFWFDHRKRVSNVPDYFQVPPDELDWMPDSFTISRYFKNGAESQDFIWSHPAGETLQTKWGDFTILSYFMEPIVGGAGNGLVRVKFWLDPNAYNPLEALK